MSSRIWLIVGFIIIVGSLMATIYYANQIMNQMAKAHAENLPAPNIDSNAAVYSSFFVGIGLIFIIIGLIKHLQKKRGS